MAGSIKPIVFQYLSASLLVKPMAFLVFLNENIVEKPSETRDLIFIADRVKAVEITVHLCSQYFRCAHSGASPTSLSTS